MVKVAMFIIGLLKQPIKWWGADYSQVENIIRTKLTMDFRRSPSMFHGSSGTSKTMAYQLFLFLFFGLFIAMGIMTVNNILLNLTICFSIIMVMLGSSVITEFSSVLFDYRDNQILLVRPISNRSLLLARLFHIQVYVGTIAVALSAIPSIVILVKHGILVFIAFWIAVGLNSWITLLITSFFYIALSKVVSGVRFKDLVSYFQIFLAVIVFGGYQLLPRIMEMDAISKSTMDIHWWTYLIPPAWLAGFVDIFKNGVFDFKILMLAFIAIIVSVGGSIFLVRFFSSGFGDVLSEGTAETGGKEKEIVKSNVRLSPIRILCVSEVERMGWKLAMSITKRDRKFKQTVYPSFGIIIVMAVIMIKPDFSSFAATMQKLSDSNNFFYFVFLGFFGTTSITQLPYTDTPEGSWIYKALPITKHGHLLTGAIKAMFFKFFAPIMLILSVFTYFVWGVEKLPSLLVAGLMIVLINLYSIIIMKMELPFTQPRDMQQRGNNMARMFFLMLLMGLTVGLTYLTLRMNDWIVFLICTILFLATVNAYSQIRNKGYILQ